MYRKHFAFTHFPFERELQTDELFASSAIAEAEVRLKHLLELLGIGLITGEVGCGKTTVCRKLTSALHSGLYRVFYVTLSTGNVMDMYKCIAWELGLPTERNRAAALLARWPTSSALRPHLRYVEKPHSHPDQLQLL